MIVVTICIVLIFVKAIPTHCTVVRVSRGISAKETQAVYENTGFDETNKDHWRSRFQQEGKAMLASAKDAKRWAASCNDTFDTSKVSIGAIVSLSESGGGVLELIRLLQNAHFVPIIVGVVFDVRKDATPREEACLKACEQILYELNLPQVIVLEKLDDDEMERKFRFTHKTGDFEMLISYMQDQMLLIEGICGYDYGATTIQQKRPTSKTLRAALQILPRLSPVSKTKEYPLVVSYITPSGRNENGDWIDCAPFAYNMIFTTTFPLASLAKEVDPAETIICRTKHSFNGTMPFLETMKSLIPELQTDVEKIQNDDHFDWEGFTQVKQA